MVSSNKHLQLESVKRTSVGWPEIAVGLISALIVTLLAGAGILALELDPVLKGTWMTWLAGLGGIAGFSVALMLRIRRLDFFGIARVSVKWLLGGAVAGAVAFGLKAALVPPLTDLLDLAIDTQSDFIPATQGGALALFLTAIGLVIVTPLGEELLFRGVLYSGLARYGPIVAAVVSALVFAIFHGPNVVFPIALIIGLITAELYRRSGSIWPGVIAHAVYNAPTVLVFALT